MQNRKINFHRLILLGLSIITFAFTSCNPKIYIQEEEAFLTDNKIQIKDRNVTKSRAALKTDLERLYKQLPNTDFAFIDREWYYFKFNENIDTTTLKKGQRYKKIKRVFGNFIRNEIAEPPSIHNESLVQETADGMQNYLRNKKGYYHARVETKFKVKDQEAKVKYLIYTGPQFKVHGLTYNCEDPKLAQLIDDIKVQTLIPPGSPIEEARFNEERNRIVRIVQDRGFPRFNSNHVQFVGDTTGLAYGMDVYFNILKPASGESHQQYTVGEIKVFTDHSVGTDTSIVKHEELKGIDFYSQKEHYEVNPNTISRRIFISEGETYIRNKELRTSQALSKLNAYRFVNLNPSIDPLVDTVINYNFLLMPIRNKKVIDGFADVYFSNVRRANQDPFNGLGISADANYATRNLANKAESWSLGANAFIEFNLAQLNTAGGALNYTESWPLLNDYTRSLWLANKVGLVNDNVYNSLNDNSTTDLQAALSYTFTATVYELTSGNVFLGYNYAPRPNLRIGFNTFGINYLGIRALPLFQEILDESPFLENSFSDRLLTGFLFDNLSYNFNSTPTSSGFNWGFDYFFETSGIEVALLNAGVNAISGSNNPWVLPIGEDNIELAKFFKIDLSHRFNQRIAGEHSIAGKFRAGIVVPFGDSETVPYVRQFAAGGQQSIRGWQLRDLGPGGYDYYSTIDPNEDIPLPFQTGDLLLETSLEYRFPLVGWLKSALFVDAGNVWLLEEDQARPNSGISSKFYNQIAVATGIGFRLDFSYFLMRFDIGYRVRNPFPNSETGSYLNYQTFRLNNLRDGNLNFGINMPF